MEINALEYWYDYVVEVLPGLPEQGAIHIFQQERKGQCNDELVLEIPVTTSDWLVLKINRTDGSTWVGNFEPGVEGISGLFATPSCNRLQEV